MSEQEKNDFRVIYNFYDRWRSTIIETDDQWCDFALDIAKTSEELSRPFGWHLLDAVINTINDLYRNGAKPDAVGYLGRADL